MGAEHAIVPQDVLVIHAGELIPKDEVRVLMRAEFPCHGYTYQEIETLLERAYKATQKFLGELRYFHGEHRNELLDVALGKDRRAAERWRAYWRAHPEQDWPGYQAAKAEKEAKLKAEREAKQAEHEAWLAKQRAALAAEERRRWEERREQYQRILAEEERKAARQRDFDSWVRRNEEGGWKAEAAERAETRRQDDQAKWAKILRRIREKHGDESYWVPRLERGGSQEAMLNLLSDTQYIQWMFEQAAHGWIPVV
jgi:hypothetical protein